MSYLKKEEVLKKVKSRTVTIRGVRHVIYEAYLGTDIVSKKPVRIASKNEDKLRQKIAAFYKRRSSGGDFAVLVTPEQAMDARMAIELLKKSGIDMSLLDCVKYVVDGRSREEKACSVTLGEAYAEYLEKQNGKSRDHISSVEFRVGGWVEMFGSKRTLSEVTSREVEIGLEKRLLHGKGEKAKTTYNNHVNYIKTFMNWCVEQGMIEKSPVSGLKKKAKAWSDIQYLGAESCAKLFGYLEEHRDKCGPDLAYAILSFFCGMRQSEIARTCLGPSAIVINLEEKFIRVIACKGATKGIKPRVFTIPDIAYRWMKIFDFKAHVANKNKQFRRHLVGISKKIGISIPENCGRHTFCTFHDAVYHDPAALTAIVGNTEEVRDKHYNGLATEKEGREFFAIMPSA